MIFAEIPIYKTLSKMCKYNSLTVNYKKYYDDKNKKKLLYV